MGIILHRRAGWNLNGTIGRQGLPELVQTQLRGISVYVRVFCHAKGTHLRHLHRSRACQDLRVSTQALKQTRQSHLFLFPFFDDKGVLSAKVFLAPFNQWLSECIKTVTYGSKPGLDCSQREIFIFLLQVCCFNHYNLPPICQIGTAYLLVCLGSVASMSILIAFVVVPNDLFFWARDGPPPGSRCPRPALGCLST
jgi:hypothetical protein